MCQKVYKCIQEYHTINPPSNITIWRRNKFYSGYKNIAGLWGYSNDKMQTKLYNVSSI